MEAGRELDALVAEKVMGYFFDPTRCDRCGWPLEKTPTAGCVKDNCSMRPMPEKRGPRPYSTDITAAYQVVNKLRERGFNVIVISGFQGNWCGCWIAEGHASPFPTVDIILHPVYFQDGVKAKGRTEAEAICLAALQLSDLTARTGR